jgi:serine/threonine protein kinase
MAPELLRSRENPQFNNKADIWALGCIVWELIFGEKAFKADWEVMQYADSQKILETPATPIWLTNEAVTIVNGVVLVAEAIIGREHTQRPRAKEMSEWLRRLGSMCQGM